MSPLKANLATLSQRWPELARSLREANPTTSFEPLASRSGAPNARYGGRLLHSSVDPVREAERLAETLCGEQATAAVVMGFGFGYLCEALVRRRPSLPLLVVEPDPGLFARALAARPLSSLLAHPELHLHVSADPQSLAGLFEPGAAINPIPLGSPCLLRCEASEAVHGAYFAVVRRILTAARDRQLVNATTLGRFGPLWVRNLLRNLVPFLRGPGVKRLAGLCEGIPALVVASGPSLDAVLPLLAKLASRCVVICVDTSLRASLAHGVMPDFLVAIDPQYWNARHLDGARCPDTILVAESATHPRALRLEVRAAFFMSSLFPLGRRLESLVAAKGELGVGGSVATTAWDLARHIGASPIVMAGLDLGYPDGATHFRGAFFEQRFLALSHRGQPAEQMAFSYLLEADPYPVPSNSGEPVLTDRRMAIYASWFQAQAARFPRVPTLTLAGRGVRIPGIELVSPSDVLALLPRREELSVRLEQACRSALGPDGLPEPPWSEVKATLRDLLADLQQARSAATEALAIVDQVSQGRRSLGDALAALDSLDQTILGLGGRDVLSFLMQPLIRSILDGREGVDVWKRSRDLYARIAESARFHERHFAATLERLAAVARSS